jgi:hypothetical protein
MLHIAQGMLAATGSAILRIDFHNLFEARTVAWRQWKVSIRRMAERSSSQFCTSICLPSRRDLQLTQLCDFSDRTVRRVVTMDISAMLQRVVRAVTFDLKFYNEAEADTNLNTEALIVVVAASLLAGIGALGGGLWGLIGGVAVSVVGYYALAYVTYVIGTNFFGGTTNVGEMQRTLGYAWAPQALGLLVLIPCLGAIGALVGGLWSFACAVVAVREAQELDTSKALLTTIGGFLVWGVLFAVLHVFLPGI